MKRLILYVGMMAATFAIGIGIHGLIWQRKIDKALAPAVGAIRLAHPEPQKEVVAPVAQIQPLPAATPRPILVLDYDREKFSPWAVFYIMGRKPKEFADFDSLEVALGGHVDDEHGYISLYTPDDTAMATFALVTERRLFFATSQMRYSEVEYRFDGEFLRTDFDRAEGKNIAVLRGTLTKSKNGRKIAEQTFSFRMEHLGC